MGLREFFSSFGKSGEASDLFTPVFRTGLVDFVQRIPAPPREPVGAENLHEALDRTESSVRPGESVRDLESNNYEDFDISNLNVQEKVALREKILERLNDMRTDRLTKEEEDINQAYYEATHDSDGWKKTGRDRVRSESDFKNAKKDLIKFDKLLPTKNELALEAKLREINTDSDVIDFDIRQSIKSAQEKEIKKTAEDPEFRQQVDEKLNNLLTRGSNASSQIIQAAKKGFLPIRDEMRREELDKPATRIMDKNTGKERWESPWLDRARKTIAGPLPQQEPTNQNNSSDAILAELDQLAMEYGGSKKPKDEPVQGQTTSTPPKINMRSEIDSW